MSSIVNNPLVGPLIKSSNIRTYEKGQTVVYPDDSNSHLFLIKSGAVMVENINHDGERKILYVLGKSALFPTVSFLEKSVISSWFYSTLMDTEVYVISYEEFAEKLKSVDGFTAYNMLLRQTLAEMHELLLHISNHAKTDSTEKIISMCLFLLEHHTQKTSHAWRPVRVPVTHQLLADMTGLTRETVSLTLKALATRRLVRYRDKANLELNAVNFAKESHS